MEIVTVVVAESLLALGSCVEEVTVTELVITAPFGVGQFTVATSVMVSDAPAGSELKVTVRLLPEPPHTPTGSTYLLPHVDPSGAVYTTVTNFDPAHKYCCASIFVDRSTEGMRSLPDIS